MGYQLLDWTKSLFSLRDYAIHKSKAMSHRLLLNRFYNISKLFYDLLHLNIREYQGLFCNKYWIYFVENENMCKRLHFSVFFFFVTFSKWDLEEEKFATKTSKESDIWRTMDRIYYFSVLYNALSLNDDYVSLIICLKKRNTAWSSI